LKTIVKTSKKGLQWLDRSHLSNSDGFKLELYPTIEIQVSEYLGLFNSLFSNFYDQIIIGHLGEEPSWGDFCLDTWDFKNDSSNFSLEGKSPSSALYLQLLINSEIEFDYSGFCACKNWGDFLPIITQCIVEHNALYSPVFIIPEDDIAFYMHHTLSFGIYFTEENSTLKAILEKASQNSLIIKNSNYEF